MKRILIIFLFVTTISFSQTDSTKNYLKIKTNEIQKAYTETEKAESECYSRLYLILKEKEKLTLQFNELKKELEKYSPKKEKEK